MQKKTFEQSVQKLAEMVADKQREAFAEGLNKGALTALATLWRVELALDPSKENPRFGVMQEMASVHGVNDLAAYAERKEQ